MTETQRFRDEDLTAYLDGEAAEPLRSEIEAALGSDPDIQARLAALRIDKDALIAGLDDLLAGAPDAPAILSEVEEGPAPWRVGPIALAASVVVCLFVGGLAGFNLGDRQDPSWQNFAATYHALYVEETLSNVSVSESAAGEELARVQEALGKAIDYEVFSSLEEMDYKRAQVLGFEGRPLIQLAFLSAQREPIALCIIRVDGTADRAPEASAMLGMSAVQWTKDGYGYLLVGGSDDALLQGAARQLVALL